MNNYQNKWQQIIFSSKNQIFLLFFLVLHIFIIKNFILLARDTLYGDFSATQLVPAPLYNTMRLEVSEFNAINRLSADFSQIYFPLKELSSLKENYINGAFDPWQRPSRYAPFIHYMCSISICKLDYGVAAFLHILIQLTLFYLSMIYAYWLLGLQKYILPSLLFVNFYLFLTPTGLSWFERGQFSLYVALAYLWLFIGLHTRKGWPIFLSALFSFVKWTSLPYIFITLLVNILTFKHKTKFRGDIILGAIFALVFVALSAPYRTETKYFLVGLYQQELTSSPLGISMALLLPRALTKSVPLVLIVLGWLLSTRYQDHQTLYLTPYFCGLATLMLTYPTLAYEYSLPILLIYIPILLAWKRLPGINETVTGKIILIVFTGFLVTASFFRDIQPFIQWPHANILLYAITALGLVCLPFFFPRQSGEMTPLAAQ